MSEREPNTFEIGLCMAGAISAGAYTAGVVDFLLEALEAWRKRKDEDRQKGENTVLSHEVVLSCMSGASAGGMTAAAVASALCGEYRPMNDLTFGEIPARSNIPYECWVESVSIEDFLGTRDLKGEAEPVVRSLLDCTRLDQVAERFMKPDGSAATTRPYVSPQLEIYLSLANLRGTPYSITFKGSGNYCHEMTQHKDYIRFRLSRTDARPGDPVGHFLQRVPPISHVTGDAVYWSDLKTAALATGAFPLALKPRVLRREQEEYRLREWAVPHELDCPKPCREKNGDDDGPFDGPVFGLVLQKLRDQFRDGSIVIEEKEAFDVLNVDGGTFDNEPLELARLHLACGELANPRSPEEANRAVVLIDPFPHDVADPPDEDYDSMDVLALAGKILGAMKSSARFKQDELLLAQDEDCYSRFLIGPSRRKEPGSERQADIACGSLGGFGGFFSRKFRQHDYMLGRRNCQWFLYQHFAVPLEAAWKNPVFAKDHDRLSRFAHRVDGQDVVPIIPLMPEVHPESGGEATVPPWNMVRISPEEVDRLRPLILERLKKVADIYLAKYVNGFTATLAKWFFLNSKLGGLADRLVEKIHKDFQQAGVE